MLFPNTPDEFICPISLEMMADPVIAMDGHSYDRPYIEQWFQEHSTSPKTGEQLTTNLLIPNYNLKKLIMDFKAQQPESARDEAEAENKRLILELTDAATRLSA